jgi:hypothetical protein
MEFLHFEHSHRFLPHTIIVVVVVVVVVVISFTIVNVAAAPWSFTCLETVLMSM